MLTGDLMTIYSEDNAIRKVIMEGNPATYRQRPDDKDQDVQASSQRMEYYTDPEHIILLKQAEVNLRGLLFNDVNVQSQRYGAGKYSYQYTYTKG